MRIRRRIGIAAAALACLTVFAVARSGVADDSHDTSVDLEIVATPVGNLFYQLECLAQQIRCSYDAYRDYWDSAGFDDRGQAVLDRFAATLDLYDTRAELGRRDSPTEHVSSFGPEITDVGPLSSQSISLLSRIRIAAYGSADRDTLRQQLGLLMHPGDVAELEAALRHFEPGFDRWWNNGVPESLARFAEQLDALMVNQAPDFLSAVADFYGVESGDGRISVLAHLMPHPRAADQIRGTIIENHAVLEVRMDESPEERLGVLVHELAHYFFASAPAEFHGRRLQGALRAGDPRAPAAMALMNEALATAIGNGVLEERLRGVGFQDYFATPKSFYATDDIDVAAKAILPLVRDYLSGNRTMDERFIDRYFSVVMERLGKELDSLEARLRVSAYVAGDGNLYDTMHRATRLLYTRSVWHANLEVGDLSDAVLTRHAYLNGVVLSREADRREFAPLVPLIDRLRIPDGAGHLACTTTRDSGSVIYIVMTDRSDLTPGDLVWMLENAGACDDDATAGISGTPFPE